MKHDKKKIESIFEGLLWNSRLIVLAAVVTSLAASLAMFYIATVDAYYMIIHLGEYVSPELAGEARSALRSSTIAHVVEIVDGYLLATVLLIFSLGLYELFISAIDQAEASEAKSNVLVIHSLDDLKGRLAKVILMILIVKYFEHAIAMKFESPADLLYLAGGITLIGLALYLTHTDVHPPGLGKPEHKPESHS
ncbi:MAG: YqhA family protein [Gammaproteobacteria bacterium]|nr:YqhA family protein [Gammaproteobacteria bacterium]